jgi:hypothetical protein
MAHGKSQEEEDRSDHLFDVVISGRENEFRIEHSTHKSCVKLIEEVREECDRRIVLLLEGLRVSRGHRYPGFSVPSNSDGVKVVASL